METHPVLQLAHFLSLSPKGVLYFSTDDPSIHRLDLYKKFMRDWREGWFHLGADKIGYDQSPSLRFWQEIAKEYITELCHLPEEAEFSRIEPPGADRLNEHIFKMPPMKGGEYLSLSLFRKMWEELNNWVEKAASEHGGIHVFLKSKAPKWEQVGKVCFHLVENKKDQSRPFAFLATYSTGFAATGKLRHLPLKRALEEASSQNHHESLVKLLSPVYKASEQCLWVKNLVETKELYQPLAWSVDKAHSFLTTIPQLEESGLLVQIPNWWKQRSRPQVKVTIGSNRHPSLGVNALLDFQVKLALDGQNLSEEELLQLSNCKESIAYIRGKWVEVDHEKLQQALDHWKKVQEEAKNGEISFIEGMRLLAGAPSDLGQLEKENPWTNISSGEALSQLLKKLRDPSLISLGDALVGINATLRPYQREGVQWLSLLSELGLGGCLADDMGLGKTLQVLSLILFRKKRGEMRSSLLVVPASLLGNWKQEAERFTPSLHLFFIHPSETPSQTLLDIQKDPQKYLKGADVVITTYSMLLRQQWLSEIKWDLLILDEAQAIKNHTTQQTVATKALKAHGRIALTGTPIENRLSDLWSLFDFLNPGLLGSADRFKEYIKTLETTTGHFDSLRRLVSPYILRRMKTDPKIISDLPEKIETPTYCQLTKKQAQYYQATVNNLKKSLDTVDAKNRRALVLETLLRLKQICNHPSQFDAAGDYDFKQSGKFIRLQNLAEELAARQEKVLVFTQFSEIIPSLAEFLREIFGQSGLILHGGTPIKERKNLVNAFQSDNGPPFFVLSLRAGGTGLTLTAASHVIHFDRWWNPAVENQATDRAFRIGQKKNVQVHKFITQGTIEEEIDKIISSKKSLANEILSASDEIRLTELSDKELLKLVTLDVDKASIT